MSQLNIILGAGFSFPAGFPLVKDFNRFFNRDIRDEFRMHSSSEWFWKELAPEVANHNGSLNNDHIAYAFVFQAILGKYGEFANYEDFYDFVTKQDKTWLKERFDEAKASCVARYNLAADSTLATMFDQYQYQKITEILNYLILDVLRLKVSENDLRGLFAPFLSLLSKYTKVRIFTLNHDLLIERLFNIEGVRFSDGHSKENSRIVGEKGEIQASFQDRFEERIHVLKMHGAVDIYGFDVGKQEGSVLYPTGQIIYFKPESYYAKHHAQMVDDQGKVIQDFNFVKAPAFITGRHKESLIKNDKMYSRLFQRFSDEMAKDADLLIIGYSYGDDHMNSVIEKNNPYQSVTNINPGKEYPYKNCKSIKNLKNIASL
jgi:hypothetical protein